MKSAHRLVEGLLKDLMLDRVKPRKTTLEHWSAVVGDRLDGQCWLSGWDGDVLKVRTCVPGVAMELGHRSSEIIAALNKLAGEEIFSSMKVILGPGGEKERLRFDRQRTE